METSLRLVPKRRSGTARLSASGHRHVRHGEGGGRGARREGAGPPLELGKPTNFDQYGVCNPAVKGKVVPRPQHDKWHGRGIPPRPRGGG